MDKKEIQEFEKRLNRNKVPSKNMIYYPERDASASNQAYADALDKYDADVENEDVRFEPLIAAHQQANETIYAEFISKMQQAFGWDKLSSETLAMVMSNVKYNTPCYELFGTDVYDVDGMYAAAEDEDKYIKSIIASVTTNG